MRKYWITLGLLMVLWGAVAAMPSTAQSTGLAHEPRISAVQLLRNDADCRAFVELLDLSGLSADWENAEAVTFLVPTNDAFRKLPPGTVRVLMQPQHRDWLEQILRYHIVRGRVSAIQLGQMSTVGSEGGPVTATFTQGRLWLGDNAKVTGLDHKADNGVLHTIDTVLVPPAVLLGIQQELLQEAAYFQPYLSYT